MLATIGREWILRVAGLAGGRACLQKRKARKVKVRVAVVVCFDKKGSQRTPAALFLFPWVGPPRPRMTAGAEEAETAEAPGAHAFQITLS